MEITLPTDERSKRLIVGAILMVMAVAGYWYYFWKPEQALITITAARADTLKINNDKARAAAGKLSEAKLRADADRFTQELTVLRRLVPTQNEVPALINDVSTAARRAGMDISEVQPDGTLPGDYFDAVKYKFAVTGPYHRIAEFLTSVGSLSRIVTPINLELTMSSAAPTTERRPGRNEQFIQARFGVMTYVAKTVATPPARTGGN